MVECKVMFMSQALLVTVRWQTLVCVRDWNKRSPERFLLQVAALLQMGRLHEASKLALKSGNRQTVRLVLEEARKGPMDSVIAE